MEFFLNATWKQKMSKRAKFFLWNIVFWKELMLKWLDTLCIKWNYWEILFTSIEIKRVIESLFRICHTTARKTTNTEKMKNKLCTKKFAEKRCPSQINIKLFTINIKTFECVFFKCSEDKCFNVIVWKKTKT